MFQVGDIAMIYSPLAGKKKYHLCVCCANEHGVERFLFINSGAGYQADFVLNDADIGCLPESPTGKSVISCSMVVRFTQEQLKSYGAKKLGDLDWAILGALAVFLEQSPALSREERQPIVRSIQTFLSN